MTLWPRIARAADIAFHGAVALGFLACGVTLFRGGGATEGQVISIGLNWVPETEHCGFFEAQAGGLYKAAGLKVEIVNGGPDVNLPLLVGSGRLDLALGTSFTTLNMQANKVDAITVAAYFQKDPQTLVAHAGQGVTRFEDLRHRPIMVGKFARAEFWQFLKATQGFTDDQLRPYDAAPSAFLADKNAVTQGYATQDGVQLGVHMPEGMVSYLIADHGFDNYSQTIFGMRGWVEGHKDEVRRFVAATAEGYRRCTYNAPRPQDDTTAMPEIMRRNPEHGVPLYHFKQRQMRDLGFIGGGDAARQGIGTMSDARWEHFFHTMVQAGLYRPDLDWRRAYSLDYLPKDPVLPPKVAP